jgi:hypothetical protein
MKNMLLLLISILIYQESNAQINFVIEELKLFNYHNFVSQENIIWDEDIIQGPTVTFNCLIYNNTFDTITLNTKIATVEVIFNYKRKKYKLQSFPLPFLRNDSIILMPNKMINLMFSEHLVLGTDIMKHNNISKSYDYTKEMLEILPTLKVIYREQNIELQSTEIKNVIIHD